MVPRFVAVMIALAACGGGSSAPHDSQVATDSRVSDGGVDSVADASAAPMYASTPTQTLVPPAGVGNGYGLIVAISADGLTLATFDVAAIYVFTRANTNAAFPASPTQTLHPSNVAVVGDSISLSGDGAVLVCGATVTGGTFEDLVYTRQGSSGLGTTPQSIAVTSGYSEVQVSTVSRGGNELLVDTSSHSVEILPRTGATFGTTPLLTIPRPTGASGFFPMGAGISALGDAIAVGDSGVSGGGAVFVYGSGSSPVQTLTPISGEVGIGNAVAVRNDGAELVEGSIYGGGSVGVYWRGPSGYARVQTIAPPAGATSNFATSVSLALDGTLVVTDYGANIYIFTP
jgi:hypothetical protein